MTPSELSLFLALRGRRPSCCRGSRSSGSPEPRSTPRSSCPLGTAFCAARLLAQPAWRASRRSSRRRSRCSSRGRGSSGAGRSSAPPGRRCAARSPPPSRSSPCWPSRSTPGTASTPRPAISCSTRSSRSTRPSTSASPTRSLTGQPPQVPGVSGFPIGYHLGTDLVRAAARRWAGTDPWDSLTRFDVTLWGLGLVLALRALAARLGAPPLAVALVPWTLLLTRLLVRVRARTRRPTGGRDLLRGNLLLSLVYANPLVPGARPRARRPRLALALRGDRAARPARARRPPGGGRSLLQGVPGRAPAARARASRSCSPAGASRRAPRRRRGARRRSPPRCSCSARAARRSRSRSPRSTSCRSTRETLGPRAARRPARSPPRRSLWLLLSLGLRARRPGEALGALRGPAFASAPRGDGALRLAARPAVPRLGPRGARGPEGRERRRPISSSNRGRCCGCSRRWRSPRFAASPHARRLLAARGAAAARDARHAGSTSSRRRRRPPDRMPAPMVRAMRALAAASRPGDVVLQRPGGRYPPAPVVLAGRRVTYERFTPYLTQFVAKADLEARHAAVYRFFRTESRDEALADRALARGVVPGALRQRPRALRHDRGARARVRGGGSAGLPDRRSRGPLVVGHPGGFGGTESPISKKDDNSPGRSSLFEDPRLRAAGRRRSNGSGTNGRTDNGQRKTDNETDRPLD